MSKGLGKTQQYILSFLTQDCKYKTAYELAAWEGVPEGEPPIYPTKSAVVSMRRAIRALAKLGLVHCGIAPYRRDLGGLQLVCWLPCQEPPSTLLKFKITSAVAEAAVIKALEQVTKSEYRYHWQLDLNAGKMTKSRHTTTLDTFCDYGEVASDALRMLERIAGENAARTAIRRAVDRLARTGEIEAHKSDDGQYRCLKLSVAQS